MKNTFIDFSRRVTEGCKCSWLQTLGNHLSILPCTLDMLNRKYHLLYNILQYLSTSMSLKWMHTLYIYSVHVHVPVVWSLLCKMHTYTHTHTHTCAVCDWRVFFAWRADWGVCGEVRFGRSKGMGLISLTLGWREEGEGRGEWGGDGEKVGVSEGEGIGWKMRDGEQREREGEVGRKKVRRARRKHNLEKRV